MRIPHCHFLLCAGAASALLLATGCGSREPQGASAPPAAAISANPLPSLAPGQKLEHQKAELADPISDAPAGTASLTLDFAPSSTLPDGSLDLANPDFAFLCTLRNSTAQPLTLLSSYDSMGYHAAELLITGINGKTLPEPITINRADDPNTTGIDVKPLVLPAGKQMTRTIFWSDSHRKIFHNKSEHFVMPTDARGQIKAGDTITLHAQYMQLQMPNAKGWSGKVASGDKTFQVKTATDVAHGS